MKKLLNDFADEAKREKMLEDATLMFNNVGEITAMILRWVNGKNLA